MPLVKRFVVAAKGKFALGMVETSSGVRPLPGRPPEREPSPHSCLDTEADGHRWDGAGPESGAGHIRRHHCGSVVKGCPFQKRKAGPDFCGAAIPKSEKGRTRPRAAYINGAWDGIGAPLLSSHHPHTPHANPAFNPFVPLACPVNSSTHTPACASQT
jgi:hypothetical protein